MIYLVPQMVSLIHNMGQTLPLHTRILIAVSSFLVSYWWIVSPRRSSSGSASSSRPQTNPGPAYPVDAFKISMPLVGPILRKIILSRFASSFAMMYSSGITVLDAIRSSEEIVGNLAIEEALHNAGQQIAEGKNLTAAFQDAGLFPPLVIRMLRVGESTGALDTALLNVSYFYNREVREDRQAPGR